MTPTNASLGFLDPAKLSRLGADGRLVSGDAPTKEVPLHTALYQTRNSARAVVHLHSTHSVALSMLPEIDPRAALPPMTPYYLMKCGATALVPYYRPGDPAVADAIKGLAGKYSSVLLANHGPVVSGDTLEAAVFAMEELEETAKLYLLLRGLNPRYLSPAQVADLVEGVRGGAAGAWARFSRMGRAQRNPSWFRSRGDGFRCALPILQSAIAGNDEKLFSRHDVPEFCKFVLLVPQNRGSRECRVRAAPAVSCAKLRKKGAHEHTGERRTLRHPLRNGFTAYYRALPGERACCHRHPRISPRA